MKDYRAFKRYMPEEWETDKEWRGRRLQFLWDVRSYYIDEYQSLKLYEEKTDFYDINDPEVSRIASALDCYSDGELERYDKMDIEELYYKYQKLERMKSEDKHNFLKKCNSHLFCYIVERRYYDIHEYIQSR